MNKAGKRRTYSDCCFHAPFFSDQIHPMGKKQKREVADNRVNDIPEFLPCDDNKSLESNLRDICFKLDYLPGNRSIPMNPSLHQERS
eukprot:11069837-Ditylum_brightwellii.AAC.1